ncbi:MAG: DUF3187 family protein [Acidobacteria bacterium]|nr:DUF3187 family protein [Acidobacteriota bacterium]
MRRALLGLTLASLPLIATAAPLERLTPVTDFLDLGSIRPDPIESIRLEQGRWSWSITQSYMNQWSLTWHPHRVHIDRGLDRQPISADEWRYIEEAFPEDDVYMIDLEGWRTDLTLSYGLPHGMTLTAEIPYVDVGGGPNWDSIAEDFHATVDENRTFGRDTFPKGQSVFYLRANGRTTSVPDASTSGIGDATLSLSMPIGNVAKEQSLVFAIQPPTGDEETVLGSGGWDASLSWYRKWRGERRSYLAGAGFSYLDSSGSMMGFERSNTYHLLGEVTQRVTKNVDVRLGVRADSATLADELSDSDLGDPAFFWRLGMTYDLPRGNSLYFDIGEELVPQTGTEADWSVHFGFSAAR